jgi:hypothetical protein
MENADRFRANSPPIIQETIDEETIIVNLQTGRYYSLNPVGTYVWGAIESGAAVDDIAADIAEQLVAESGTVEGNVRAFVDQLVEEELIVPREDDAPAAQGPARLAGSVAYEAPALNRYTDMQELLLLDPVHEVDAAGWPARG